MLVNNDIKDYFYLDLYSFFFQMVIKFLRLKYLLSSLDLTTQ